MNWWAFASDLFTWLGRIWVAAFLLIVGMACGMAAHDWWVARRDVRTARKIAEGMAMHGAECSLCRALDNRYDAAAPQPDDELAQADYQLWEIEGGWTVEDAQ